MVGGSMFHICPPDEEGRIPYGTLPFHTPSLALSLPHHRGILTMQTWDMSSSDGKVLVHTQDSIDHPLMSGRGRTTATELDARTHPARPTNGFRSPATKMTRDGSIHWGGRKACVGGIGGKKRRMIRGARTYLSLMLSTGASPGQPKPQEGARLFAADGPTRSIDDGW
jgi:hypothetical protein